MTRAEVIDHVHITTEGECLHSGLLDEADMDWVEDHPAIVTEIIARRQNTAGFYVSFPVALEQILKKSKTLSIDLETTNPTKFAPAIKITAKSHIGDEPLSVYRATCAAEINMRPRIRVIAVHIPEGDYTGEYVWDLDAMSTGDRQRLIDAVIDNPF